MSAVTDRVGFPDDTVAKSRVRVQVVEVFLLGSLGGVDVVGAGDLLGLACRVDLVRGEGKAVALEVRLFRREACRWVS